MGDDGMKILVRKWAVRLVVAVACGWPVLAAAPSDVPSPAAVTKDIDFVRDIQPLLRARCYACHSHDLDEAELRLDVKERAFAGGQTGPVILPGRSAESLLVQLVAGVDAAGRRMPPEDEGAPLSEDQVALLRAWIDQGAKWPADADVVVDIKKLGASHWAYQPVVRTEPPQVDSAIWATHPVDRFIRAAQEDVGLKEPAVATPNSLVRRVYFNLIGLPPPPDVVDQFASDPSRQAYEKLIDRLLSSPAYGERWARHWLDLVRYADTNGYEVDGEKPFAWRYRDYVVAAFNDDKPYDQFVIEQLAGDELEGANPETFIATGYIRMGQWDAERGASVQKSEMLDERANELDDMVSTTAQVFLGLTMGCARCHDHKFDALSARDYYSMAAIFNALTRPRQGRAEKPRALGTREQLAAKEKADAEIATRTLTIDDLFLDLLNAWLDSGKSKLSEAIVAAWKEPRGQRGKRHKRVVQDSRAEVIAELNKAKDIAEFADKLSAEARADLARLREEIAFFKTAADLPQGYYLWEPSPEAPPTHFLIRGSSKRPGEEVPAAVPAVFGSTKFLSPSAYTSRRRLSLARWIVRADNPLTARVIVNRVWQRHYGYGLVRSVSDFGVRGDAPSHPQLLDWLSDWFVNDGAWSIKRLQRLIMTSNAYRMSKRWDEAAYDVDPDNRLLWRFPYHRIEMEAIRDSILAVSGKLSQKMGGPSTYPLFPDDAKRGSFHFGKSWKEFDEAEASRRTIYAYIKRTMVHPMFDVLDFCDTSRSADRRTVTTVAPQALLLFNGEFVNRQAGHLADRLLREAGDDPRQHVERAYRLALSRRPTTEEIDDMMSFLVNEEQNLRGALEKLTEDEIRKRALAQACRVLFNLNEFVYTD